MLPFSIILRTLTLVLFTLLSQLVLAQAVIIPTVTKSFTPSTVNVNDTSQLVITIDNTASAVDAISLVVVDAFPTGMTVADPAVGSSTCNGGLTASPGDSGITLVNGSVTAGGSCQIAVNVTATSAGALVNTTTQVSSSAGTSSPAMATLTVDAAPALPQPVPMLPPSLLTLLVAVLCVVGASRLRALRTSR